MSSRDIYGKILQSGGPSHEADDNHNDLQRQLVAAFHKENPGAHVGKVNRYDPQKELLYPYAGEKVYNFQIDFIVPGFDQALLDMLAEWNSGGRPASLAGDIYDRVTQLGGYNLSFS